MGRRSQVVYELFYTNQRIAQITDFDIYGLIPGFLHALHASTVEALYSVFFSPLNWPFLFAIFSVTLFFVVMILYKIDNFDISDRVRNAKLWLLLSLVLFAAGYAPYAITEMRFTNGRALIFSRFGLCVFLSICISIFFFRRSKNHVFKFPFAIFVAIIGFFTMNQKLIIADQMGKKSVEHRQFLGDIAELLPDVDSGSRFFIDATKLPRTANGTIVRNATILLRYLYRDKKISAISNTTYRSEKGWVYYNPENKTIYEKKKNRFQRET